MQLKGRARKYEGKVKVETNQKEQYMPIYYNIEYRIKRNHMGWVNMELANMCFIASNPVFPKFCRFTCYISQIQWLLAPSSNGDLINSRFGVSYFNFSFLTPTFWKVSIDKYGKTPTLSGGQYFTPIFKILVRTLVQRSMKIPDSMKTEWGLSYMKYCINISI